MACVQHPGAHQHWNVDAGGIGCGWREAVVRLGCGGRWTKRAVSSSVRQSLLLAPRSRTSASSGRWAEGMKSKRSAGGGKEKSNNRKRMAALRTALRVVHEPTFCNCSAQRGRGGGGRR